MALTFGLFDHMERIQGIPLEQEYRERLDFLALTDRLGFWGYHLAEHHNSNLSVAPSQNVFLAAAAQRTERLRLCSLVYCLPLYHPLRLAEEIAMVDHLSGGRLEIGVGRGISVLEHRFFGHDAAEAAPRFREDLDVLVAALTQERVTYQGTFHRFDDVPVVMRPLQQPHPPFWYAGNLAFAAEHGMNFLGGGSLRSLPAAVAEYRERREAAGGPGLNPQVPEPRVGVVKTVFVADTDAEAEQIVRRAFKVRAGNWPKPGYDEGELGPTHPSIGGDADRALRIEALVAGSPERVREYVRAYEATGMNYFVGAFTWGDLSREEATHSLELFANAVMSPND